MWKIKKVQRSENKKYLRFLIECPNNHIGWFSSYGISYTCINKGCREKAPMDLIFKKVQFYLTVYEN